MDKDPKPDPPEILRPFDELAKKSASPSPHETEEAEEHDEFAWLLNFWEELKRRKVMRVAFTYLVVGWLVIQVADATFMDFGIPVWAYRFVVLMVALGFPISLVLAWAFELTPDGLKTTKMARQEVGYTKNPFRTSRIRNWLAYTVGALVPTLIFGSLAIFFYFQNRSHQLAQPVPVVAPVVAPVAEVEIPKKGIAVLPLTNLSADPENEFFADGIQEDILTNLSKVDEFHVISRSSTLQYRNPDRNMKQVGAQLNVRYVVEGSVRYEDNQVQVTVQLIDTQDDSHLWAENYVRDLDNVFDVQSDVTQKIAAELKAVISPEEFAKIEHRPTENQEAYRYYKERLLIEKSPSNLGKKIELLEKAVAADPEFGEAWSLLAVERIFRWYHEEYRNDPALLASAREAFAQAEEWGQGLPDLSFARSSFAYGEHMDVEGSIDHLLDALALDPNYHVAQWLLVARYHNIGNLAEAQHHGETLLRMDPLFSFANRWLYRTYLSRRMYEKAWALVCDNLGRTGMEVFWQKALADTEYLMIGDRDRFLGDLDHIDEIADTHAGMALKSLVSRDYPTLLESLSHVDQEKGLALMFDDIFRFDTFNVGPPSLLAALAKFQMGEGQRWDEEVERAVTYFEYVVSRDTFSGPDPLAKLAICYALKGDRQSTESTIAKVRALTADVAWKYRFQVACEMNIAIAHLVLGDKDQALDALESANSLESPFIFNRELDLWFIFDGLRGDPRFEALLEG